MRLKMKILYVLHKPSKTAQYSCKAQHTLPKWPTQSGSGSFMSFVILQVPSFTLVWLLKSLHRITFPCPPLQSCGPQESCTWESASLQEHRGGSEDCEAQETDTELGVAGILSVVYAVFVKSLLASDKRGRPVAATAPAPCRNGS